jgi:SHS2 domain-containing protein
VFEILEHTADIGFRARARSLPELFESAAAALVAMCMETAGIQPRKEYALGSEGDSHESLLVNWLNDVLYRVDGERLALRDFQVADITPQRVRGTAWGEPRHAQRHPPKLIVKGVTYHQLRISDDEEGWFCEVYLDI